MSTRRVVIFDLDRTLTYRDSFLPYLLGFLLRHPSRLWRIALLLWPIVKFFYGLASNTELKQRFLSAILGGASKAQVRPWTRVFVNRLLDRGLRPAGLATLERHRREGDLLVLLSASLDLYVQELGRRLGFDRVLCTQGEWVGEKLSGSLAGPNYRDEQKVRCLVDLRQELKGATVIAYADHHSDLAFLVQVDQGILVNGSRKTIRLAQQQGLACARWVP